MTGGRLVAGVALAMLAVRPLAAQVESNPPLWRWVDAKGGFCIWYFADPAIARKLLPDGVAIRTTAQTSGLPDVLIRIAQDEPRFAAWVPGVVCVGRYAVVAANGVPVARIDKEGRPVEFVLTALAGKSTGMDSSADWRLLELGLKAGKLDRVGEDLRIASEDRELWVRKGLEGEDTQWSLRLDGAELVWQGHSVGAVRVGTTRSMSFGYTGERDSRWLVEVRLAPAGEQDQVGSLRVQGKGTLAEALQSSPIRAIGALREGGEVVMTWLRDPEQER